MRDLLYVGKSTLVDGDGFAAGMKLDTSGGFSGIFDDTNVA